MPQRPRSHELEDRSRAKFSLALPNAWVFRNKDKDYGIDGEVEVFDSQGRATGLLFYVQLKATDALNPQAQTISLKLDALRYYRSLDIPVLLARYVEQEDAFFVKWASTVDTHSAQLKGQATITVSFLDTERWSAFSAQAIQLHLTKRRALLRYGLPHPIPTLLQFSVEHIGGIPIHVWAASLRLALRGYSEAVTLDDSDSALVTVMLQDSALTVSASGLYGCVFDEPERLASHPDSASLVAEQILVGLCVVHVQSGHADKAGQLIRACRLEKALSCSVSVLEVILPKLLRSSSFELAIEIAEAADAKGTSMEIAFALQTSMLMRGEDAPLEQLEAIERYLLRRVAHFIGTKDTRSTAISHYNLANFYRGRRRTRNALHHYIRALRADDVYKRQSYLFAEAGGVLFERGHFKWALRAYRHALTLDGVNSDTRALCADAAMFAGEYEAALSLFKSNHCDRGDCSPEWVLKAWCLSTAVAMTGLHRQERRTADATSIAGQAIAGDGRLVEELNNALKADMLCGLAWFNLANAASVKLDYSEAAQYYAFSGLLQRWDIEAWVRSTQCCLAAKPVVTQLPLVIRVAYTLHGDAYLRDLYSWFHQLKFPPEIQRELANIIEPLVMQDKALDRPVIRVLDQDGVMKPINEIAIRHATQTSSDRLGGQDGSANE